jgi:hypothetical protein
MSGDLDSLVGRPPQRARKRKRKRKRKRRGRLRTSLIRRAPFT